MTGHPRFLNAGNAGPFTLDGTRTWLVGERDVAIIDPGPDVDSHVRALASAVEDAASVTILLTHGHGDHSGAAPGLARVLGVPVLGPRDVPEVDTVIEAGHRQPTDAGVLVARHTPGHTPEHLAFHWIERRALFVGDLMLGRGDTTWVAEYPGCVADYLRSLDDIAALDLEVLYPAHGDPLDDPADAVRRYERHRRARIAQARAAIDGHPDATIDELVDVVYGPDLAPKLRGAATRSLAALVDFVRDGDDR